MPKNELRDVLNKIAKALKPGGYFYTSFKYGEFEGERSGRHFTDFTAETFRIFLDETSALRIVEDWISTDVRPEREDEKWLNLVMQKNSSF